MRVKIGDGYSRNLFFDSLKGSSGLSFLEIKKKFSVPKSTFDNYRSGKCLLPEDLFNQLISLISDSERTKFLSSIEKFPDNFGQVVGGRMAYKINLKKFNEGRINGLHSMHKGFLKPIKFSLDLTPGICEIVGAFIGDGSFNIYQNKLYQVSFAGDSRYDIHYYTNIVIPIIKSIVPDINPHFYKQSKKEHSQRIVFYSKKLFIFFRDYLGFVPGKKSHTVKIPERIMNSGDLLINATVRGIFDTDGCVFIDRRRKYKLPYPRICLQIVSKPLYDQLLPYLYSRFSLYTRFNEKRHIYIIEIYGINQVKRWMSLIGFSNKRHLNKLASIAQLVQERDIGNVEVPGSNPGGGF